MPKKTSKSSKQPKADKADKAWVEDLRAFMRAHPINQDSYPDLPGSVKEAHLRYSEGAEHGMPGIEIAFADCRSARSGLCGGTPARGRPSYQRLKCPSPSPTGRVCRMRLYHGIKPCPKKDAR
jgi:hypothetical protein